MPFYGYHSDKMSQSKLSSCILSTHSKLALHFQDELSQNVPVVIETEKPDPTKPRPKGIVRPAPQVNYKGANRRTLIK